MAKGMKEDFPDFEVISFILIGAILWVLLIPVLVRWQCTGWLTAVYDFQNLLAGVLAIVAAVFTVLQMRRSDAIAEKRHQRAIEERQEEIRQKALLCWTHVGVPLQKHQRQELVEQGDPSWDNQRAAAFMRGWHDTLRELLQKKEFLECAHLFGHQVPVQQMMLQQRMESFWSGISQDETEGDLKQSIKNWKSMSMALKDLVVQLQKWVETTNNKIEFGGPFTIWRN